MPNTKTKTKKCSICGLSFPSNVIVSIRGKNYCEKCEKQYRKEAEDLKYLKDQINNRWKPQTGEWPFLMKQIKEFKEQGFTYRGLGLTVEYIDEYVDDFLRDENSGIGILPFYYQKAKDFYIATKKAFKTEDFVIEKILNLPNTRIILNRSDLYKKDKEYQEKINKLEHKGLMNLDNIEDDGLIIEDYINSDEIKNNSNLYNEEIVNEINDDMLEQEEEE